jgi:hypothetical protein
MLKVVKKVDLKPHGYKFVDLFEELYIIRFNVT